jgi:hypothetical protein
MKTTNNTTQFNHNLKPARLAFLAALMLIAFVSAVIPAAAQDAESQSSPRLALSSALNSQAVPIEVVPNVASPALAAAYCTFFFTGMAQQINCAWDKINANSHVFLAISEFAPGNPGDRFIGDAQMTIHNIAPHAGGVTAEVDVNWPSNLNVRLDVLVD